MNALKSISTAVAVLGLFGSIAKAEIPLPPDVAIIPPGPDVPKDVAAFVGKWSGDFSNVLKAVLIVEEVKGDSAKLIYAWDDAPAWKTEKGGGYHREGKIVRGNPTQIEFSTFTVRMGESPDTIEITRIIPRRVDTATFRRVTP